MSIDFLGLLHYTLNMKIENKDLKLIQNFINKEKSTNNDAIYFLTLDKTGHWIAICKNTASNTINFQCLSLIQLNIENAKLNTKLVATCDYLIFNGKHNPNKKEIYLSMLEVISSQNYNKGYGTLLLRFLENEAHALNLKQINGICVPLNNADPTYVKNFYKTNGYTLTKFASNLSLHKNKKDFRTFTIIQKKGINFMIDSTPVDEQSKL